METAWLVVCMMGQLPDGQYVQHWASVLQQWNALLWQWGIWIDEGHWNWNIRRRQWIYLGRTIYGWGDAAPSWDLTKRVPNAITTLFHFSESNNKGNHQHYQWRSLYLRNAWRPPTWLSRSRLRNERRGTFFVRTDIATFWKSHWGSSRHGNSGKFWRSFPGDWRPCF